MKKILLFLLLFLFVQTAHATDEQLTCMYNTSVKGNPLIILHRYDEPSIESRIGKPMVFANYDVRDVAFHECERLVHAWIIDVCVGGDKKHYECLANSIMNIKSPESDDTVEKGINFVTTQMAGYLQKFAEQYQNNKSNK